MRRAAIITAVVAGAFTVAAFLQQALAAVPTYFYHG